MYAFAQMRNRDDFELCMHGIPKKTVTRDNENQRSKIVVPKDRGKNRNGRERAEADNTHALTSAIGEPAPDIRRDNFGALQNTRERADRGGAVTELAQIQRPERQPRTEHCEVKKIKTRNAP